MALTSSRLLIAQGLQLFLAGVQNPNTSQALFGVSKLGTVLDPSGLASWVEVVDPRTKGGPAGSGGNQIGWRIDEAVTFQVMAGWPYESDTTAAMTAMLTAMDILVPILRSHYQIPNPNNPSIAVASGYSMLEEAMDFGKPVRYPNGHVYLCWYVFPMVKQQYNVILTNP